MLELAVGAQCVSDHCSIDGSKCSINCRVIDGSFENYLDLVDMVVIDFTIAVNLLL